MKEFEINKIYCGNCLDILQTFPNECIDLVITSPPYFQQRTYGSSGLGNENKVEEYIHNLMLIFRECVRVTKNTGSIVFNIGDNTLMEIYYWFLIVLL